MLWLLRPSLCQRSIGNVFVHEPEEEHFPWKPSKETAVICAKANLHLHIRYAVIGTNINFHFHVRCDKVGLNTLP